MMLKVAKLGIAIAAVLAWIVPAAYAGVPDVTQSFFVPQRGSVGTPTEGTAATASFKMCPNNDPYSMTLNARVRVIVKDVNGVGIPGIAAADICVLFNGGTGLQGFSGVGADSIIANNGAVTNGICPNVRCIQADAPTAADGSTYITFRGNDGVTPGVAIRDPNRKWGHWDTEVPVYVLGFKLPGRLSSTQLTQNPAYILRFKNLDVSAGLNNVAGAAEIVSGADYSAMLTALGTPTNPFRYWYDVNVDGIFSGSDASTVLTHLNHKCDFPTNP